MENIENKEQIKPVPKKPIRPVPPKPAPQKPVATQKPKEEEIKEESSPTQDEQVEEVVEEKASAEQLNEDTATVYSKEEKKSKLEKNQKTKEKKVREKPQKKLKEKSEKKKKNKKKILIFTFLIIFVLLLIAGGVTALVLINKENNKKLSAPTLEVVQLYNGTVLKTNEIKGATKYEFVIKDLTNHETVLTSTTNCLELSSYLNQPGKYSARARVYGKGEGATSEFSETKEFTSYETLSAPKIFVNNLESTDDGYKTNTTLMDDTISWDAVKNAAGYEVRYGVDFEEQKVKTVPVTTNSSVVTFNLNEIYGNGTGLYQISVVAIPAENSYYLTSEAEGIVKIEYYAKQTAVSNAEYNRETKTLTFELPENGLYGNEFDLFITYAGGSLKQHKIYMDSSNSITEQGKVTTTINLSQIVVGDVLNMSVVTLSDGAYSTNSEPSIVEMK